MSDIFISYASEDRGRAQMLAQTFEEEGWSTFWDRTIPVGMTWRQVIGKELTEARCLVVLWSRASIDSTWVQEEADEGQRREILIPILIEDVLPPIGFRSVQAGDLSDWDGTKATPVFQRLVSDIARVIGPPPLEAEDEPYILGDQERRRAEEQARHEAEEREQAEEEAKRKADAAAKRKAEREAKRKAEDAAKREAEANREVEAKQQAKLVGSQYTHSVAVLVVNALVFAVAVLVTGMAGGGRSGDNAAAWVMVLFELGFPMYAFRLFRSGMYVALSLGLLGMVAWGIIIIKIFSH